MPEPRTYHVPTNARLFCTGIERLDKAGALQRHRPAIVVSNRIRLGGRR